jgi:hypothetical protein
MRLRRPKSILLCAAAAAIAAPTALAIDTTVPLPTSTSVPLPTSTSVPLPTSTTVPLPTSTSVPLPISSSPPPPPSPTSVVSTVSKVTSSLARTTTSATPTVSSVASKATTTSGTSTGSGKAEERAAAVVFAPVVRPVSKLHMTRTWVRSGSRRSAAKIAFRLRRGGIVHFVLTQVSPRCRRVGSFSARAHRGRNEVRLRGRRLAAGTYVLTATVRGRPLVGVTIVVAASRPTARELARARSRHACAAVLVRRVFFSRTIFRAPTGSHGPLAKPSGSAPLEAAAAVPAPGNVLGAEFAKPASSLDLKRLFLFVACGLAIVLLGLAVLPATAFSDPRLGMRVERRRIELALAGGGTLVGALLSYLAAGG